jgi:hypothetical protein
MVQQVVFDRLGRPSFFDEAVEIVMGRIAARIETGEKACATGAPQESGDPRNGKSNLCAFAPQESGIRELAEREAQKLKREIERGFVEKGTLGLPGHCAG